VIGLGLNISKKIVQLMNGDMWFESRADNGSTFFFTIKAPVVKLKCPNSENTSENDAPIIPKNPNVKILVAEDNLMNQKVVLKLLNHLGYYNVTIVENGLKAIEAMRDSDYKIILMDCMMPVVTGYEATERIRAEIPEHRQPKIVAITADAFKDNADKCLAVGMDAIIHKP
jgi:CheY-like chemotaxis protein